MKRPQYFQILAISVTFFTVTALHANQYYRDGKLAFSEKDYSRAMENFRQALKIEPENGNPLFYIGYIQEYTNHKEDAISSYKSAINLRMDPDLKEKAYWKIVLYYKYQQDWTALSDYSKRFLNFREIPDVRRLLETAEERRDPALAEIVTSAREAQKLEEEGKEEEAQRIYKSLVELRNDYEQGHWKIAVYQMKREQYAEALIHLRDLIRLNPESWQYFYKAAVCEYKVGNFSESLNQLGMAKKLNEESGDTFTYYVNLSEGLNLLEMGDFKAAREKLKGLLKDRIVASYGALARAEAASGNGQRARELYAVALKGDPMQRDALIAQYITGVSSGVTLSQGEMNTLLNQLQSTSPSGIPIDLTAAMARQARNSFQKNQFSDVINILHLIPATMIARLFPPQASPNGVSVSTHAQKQNSAEELLRYMPLEGTSEEYHYLLARSYIGLGDYSSAAMALNPAVNTAHKSYLLSKIEALKGNYQMARYQLEIAIKNNSAYKDVARQDPAFITLASNDADFSIFLFGPPSRPAELKGTKSDIPETDPLLVPNPESTSLNGNSVKTSEN